MTTEEPKEAVAEVLDPVLDSDPSIEALQDDSWMKEDVPGLELPEKQFDKMRRERRESTGNAEAVATKDAPDAEADEPAAEAEAKATDAEDANAEADQDEKPADRSEWVDTVSSLLGTNIESNDAALERIRAMKDENEGFTALRGVLSGNEEMGEFFRLMLEDEFSPAEAAAKAWDSLALSTPDPYDDPEAYAEHMRRKGRTEAEQQFQQQQEQQQQQRVERARTDLDRAFTAFKEKNKLADQKAQAFQERFALYRLGDPETGRIPPDVFEREWKAENFDAEIKKAREEGLAAGRNEAIKNLTSRRGMRGDTIPALSGSRKASPDIGADAKKSQDRVRRFAQDGSFDHSWPPKG